MVFCSCAWNISCGRGLMSATDFDQAVHWAMTCLCQILTSLVTRKFCNLQKPNRTSAVPSKIKILSHNIEVFQSAWKDCVLPHSRSRNIFFNWMRVSGGKITYYPTQIPCYIFSLWSDKMTVSGLTNHAVQVCLVLNFVLWLVLTF